jgi:hypothetical protein
MKQMKLNVHDDGRVEGVVVGSAADTGAGGAPPTGNSTPLPRPQGAPMSQTPADGKTYTFNGVPANVWFSTYAGGDGKFSASVPNGNANWVVKVNGSKTVDGSMDYSKVKKGDAIEWMITTPDYQDSCNYTLSLP